ncbi:hypothetical protein CBER1_04369 [Cercospora berteroae]|uniref:Malic acid transport protein n=1 Tax=Cercospora berteroae TaxID=357750 RepID=A0A2S6CJ89_9PEZI|nr:hypothetical protein CBER1_04369 [Cercospora berteroae]
MGHHEQPLWWRKWKPSRPNSYSNSRAQARAHSPLAGQKSHREGGNNYIDSTTPRKSVSLRIRLQHFTWAWFTLPMSTGGIALLLHATPHQFAGLITIGKVVYILDIVIFLLLCSGIAARFILYPGTLRKSLMHPTEALFFPTFWLAAVNVVIGTQVYGVETLRRGDAGRGGEWLITTLRVLFWIYLAITFLVAVLQYLYLFSAKPRRLTIQSMTPAWILPIFPAMLSGTLASAIASDQPVHYRLSIILAGLTMQGLG